MRNRIQSLRAFLLCLLVVVALTGCVSDSLRMVHDTYQSEFQAQLSEAPVFATAGEGAGAMKAEQFPVTLSAIASFRQEHPTSTNAAKHVTVLEALIYLQTQRYGHARLAARTAREMPGSLTTFGGGLTRDELLLEAMIAEPGLIEAWEILAPPDNHPKPTTEDIADTAGQLESIASREEVPAGDDGLIYLAAVASLLRMKEMDRVVNLANSKDEHDKVPEIKNKYGRKIKATIEPHLLAHEKHGSDEDVAELSKWAVRYRYVRAKLEL